MESPTSKAVEDQLTSELASEIQDTVLGDMEDASSMQLPKIIPFEKLARCGEEIWIENNGQIYRLRRTKQGKLILTK